MSNLENRFEFIFEENEKKRIDVFLCEKLEGFTRSHIQKMVEENNVCVNNSFVKTSLKLKNGDVITGEIPKPREIEAKAEDIPIEVVYEDDDLLVVNKPQGMVVHPAAGNYDGTLVNALLYRCGDSLSGINGEKRPGILHRIDKDTSGLLLVAKNDNAHVFLAEQIKEHSLTREYKALVHGNVKEESGTVNAPIGRSDKDRKKMTITYKNSKEAVTHFFVIDRFEGYTLLRLRLETGRTHQIRVHMSKKGHSVVGDKTYGIKKEPFNLKGQLLHAYKIGFIHPTTKEYMEFESQLPKHFAEVLEKIKDKKV